MLGMHAINLQDAALEPLAASRDKLFGFLSVRNIILGSKNPIRMVRQIAAETPMGNYGK